MSATASPAPTKDRTETLLSLPSMLWMACFFAGPAIILLATAFRTVDSFGRMGPVSTLEHWHILREPAVQEAFFRTLWTTAATVVGCLAIALPVSWRIVRLTDAWRSRMLALIAAPFLTSFLVRVYSWRILLQEEGWIASTLRSFSILPEGTSLLYNQAAVVLVMIYTYLPLAILPVYAAMNRFEMDLYEAARDLGATKMRAFLSVVMPNVSRGIFAAALSVGVPALGSYVIPEMIGGMTSETIGSKIAHKLFTDRNLPQAAVLASLLAALSLPLVFLAFRNKSSTSES